MYHQFSRYALLLVCAVISGISGLYGYRATIINNDNNSTNAKMSKILTIGDRRPDFSLLGMNGELRTISEWDGRIILLNFWASWCSPCVREIPAFQKIYQDYRDQNVEVIGVAIDEPNNIRSYLKRVTVTYPILQGRVHGSALMQQLGNAHGTLPYTLVIDENARISIHSLNGELNYRQIQALLESLLETKKPLNNIKGFSN